ncbi:MAG: hydroxylamine reductase, partial [bacterium]|nr:hydroxylamine reductase [bacterium]
MLCYQCEQTYQGTGCAKHGVCGKAPAVSDLQDLLVYISKGVSMYAHRARKLGVVNKEIDVFISEALFSTVTNVNFDEARLRNLILRAVQLRSTARQLYTDAARTQGVEVATLSGPAVWQP